MWLSRLVRKPDALGPSVDGSRPITDWGIGTLREPIVICDGNRQSPTPSSNVVTSPWEVAQSGRPANDEKLPNLPA